MMKLSNAEVKLDANTITSQALQAAEREYRLNLCKRQGRLFELAVKLGYNSEAFVSAYMNSFIAAGMDAVYNRYQWVGEEYLLEELLSSNPCIPQDAKTIDADAMYWMGYLYRYWHFYKNITSKKIYKLAPFKRMQINYLYFHSMAPELAIDDLMEIYEQKKGLCWLRRI